MTRLMTGALCLLVAGSALGDPDAEREAEKAQEKAPAETAAEQHEAAPRGKVRQVDLTRQVDAARQLQDPVCVREAPTGSRISITRCHAPVDPNSAAAALARDLERQEFEMMRQRQMQMEQEQARRAREASIRRPDR